MEQILMLFNPSLEIQTTDNYVDWSSLSVVELTNVSFSTRSIPIGTESEIDIAQLGFTTPIYINLPAKVKKLGVITSVVMSIFDESKGTIDLGNSTPQLMAYSDAESSHPQMDRENDKTVRSGIDVGMTTYKDYDILVMNNIAQIVDRGVVGSTQWDIITEALPGQFRTGLSQIQLKRKLLPGETGSISVNASVAINELDRSKLILTYDADTIPTNTDLNSPSGRNNTGSVDYIVDPLKFNPATAKTAGLRLLLLGAINTSSNVGVAGYDGPDAWKNADGTDFIASENDICEWDGTKWVIVFDASTKTNQLTDITYVTNLNTGIQYKWDAFEWVLSFEGEYPDGTWRIVF